MPPATPDELHPLVRGISDRLERAQTIEKKARRVIAVGSGKGGVGKTLVSSSLALSLSELSRNPVVAMDVDLGGANLHTGLGIKRPSFGLNRFILDSAPLKALSVASGIDGLQFVGGASDIIGLAEFSDRDRDRFLDELETFRDETIVLDLGAGSSLFNLDLFCTADQGILVTTTEPTAVQNAYGFLRAAIYRRMRLLFQGEEALLDMLGDAMNHRGNEETDSVPMLIQRVSRYNRTAASRLEEIVNQLKIGLVVNMAKVGEATAVADRLAQVVRQYLGARLELLGNVDFDTSVRRSVREWRPFVVHFPRARAARKLGTVALRVADRLQK
jgi:flagellar biosynthesis protein FlhG